jgi:hypothetical protein
LDRGVSRRLIAPLAGGDDFFLGEGRPNRHRGETPTHELLMRADGDLFLQWGGSITANPLITSGKPLASHELLPGLPRATSGASCCRVGQLPGLDERCLLL